MSTGRDWFIYSVVTQPKRVAVVTGASQGIGRSSMCIAQEVVPAVRDRVDAKRGQ
jgi:NADP-dependent 3-hydroxy acid dehydrogenase YdfG